MNFPNPAERTEIQIVSDAIVACLTAGRKWDVQAWMPRALLSPRFAGISVSLAGIVGAYNDMSLVRATSNITIMVPNQRVVPSLVTAAEIADLGRVVHGALAHECTHVIQRQSVPTTFGVAMALEAKVVGKPAVTPTELFEFYIGQPLEQEARAVQAATEVLTLIGTGASQTAFNAELPNTEVWSRTAGHIGSPATATGAVQAWWQTWAAMAYDAYV